MEAGDKGSTQEPTTEELFEQLMAEKGGLIPSGFAKTLEADFGPGNMGVARRCAMIFLERQFSEVVADVKRDREVAAALAEIQLRIGESLNNYRLLQEWLKASQVRLMFAICARADSEEIFAEAEREHAKTSGRTMQ